MIDCYFDMWQTMSVGQHKNKKRLLEYYRRGVSKWLENF